MQNRPIETIDLSYSNWGRFSREDHPLWVQMCQEIAVKFDEGNIRGAAKTVTLRFSFSEQSFNSISQSSDSEEEKRRKEAGEKAQKEMRDALIREIAIWNIQSFRILLQNYIRDFLEKEKPVKVINHDGVIIDKKLFCEKLIDEFVCNVVKDVVNKTHEFRKSNYRIQEPDILWLRKAIEDDYLDILKEINAKKKEVKVEVKVEAEAAPAPELKPTKQAVKNINNQQKRREFNWITPVLIGVGSIVAVLLLAAVVGATHGAALPLIFTVGAATLFSHGGPIAAMVVGCTLFGSLAAVAGAGVSYAAKKVTDGFRWLFGKAKDVGGHVAKEEDKTPLMAAAPVEEDCHVAKNAPRKDEARNGEAEPDWACLRKPTDSKPSQTGLYSKSSASPQPVTLTPAPVPEQDHPSLASQNRLYQCG